MSARIRGVSEKRNPLSFEFFKEMIEFESMVQVQVQVQLRFSAPSAGIAEIEQT